jgi:hypothetical protein
MLASRGYPIGWAGRMMLVVWSLLLLGGFALARSVDPDPRGFGTHQRFGLPPCAIVLKFGIRCPSCGMTTCFAHFTRGRLPSAAGANAAGLLLAITCAIQIPWGLASAARGRLLWVEKPDAMLFWLLLILSGTCLVDWIFRLL